jgi:hypothetical protein
MLELVKVEGEQFAEKPNPAMAAAEIVGVSGAAEGAVAEAVWVGGGLRGCNHRQNGWGNGLHLKFKINSFRLKRHSSLRAA